MLCGSSALILEWASQESPWIFENPKLSELFQNCLFHFFVNHRQPKGAYAGALNLSKNLTLGFHEFSKDCEASLKVLRYGMKFRAEVHPQRMERVRGTPEVAEFSNEFPFFFQKNDNLRQAAV